MRGKGSHVYNSPNQPWSFIRRHIKIPFRSQSYPHDKKISTRRRFGSQVYNSQNKFGDTFPASIELQVLETKIGIMALAWIRERGVTEKGDE